MKSKAVTEQEVEKTLASLDGVERANVNPFLFTKVMARLKQGERNLWSNGVEYLSRPVVAFATIFAATVINAVIYFESRSESPQSSGEGEQLFANEYNLTDNTIYDSSNEPE